MFTELMPLLRKRRLLLTISLVEGDTIRATVVPQKASDTEDNALTTPLAITGTARNSTATFLSNWWNSLGRTCNSEPPWRLPKPKWMQPQKRLAKRHGRKPRSRLA
jgi:hypothetical protein